MLFSLAEIKIIQSNHGVFKSFTINQSESSIKLAFAQYNQMKCAQRIKFKYSNSTLQHWN